MKKTLGFICGALLILALFVGCSLASQLEGTEWTKTYSATEDMDGVDVTMKYDFTLSLQKDNVASFGMNGTMTCYGYSKSTSDSVSGTWVVEDDQLTVAIEDITISCTAEIKDDALVITGSKVTGDETGAFATSMFNGSWAKVTK